MRRDIRLEHRGFRCNLHAPERPPLQVVTLTRGAAYARRRRPCRCQPCSRAVAHVAAAPAKGFGLGRSQLPLVAGLADPAWGLAVAGHTSSLLPSL
ncbi:hypothetical protein BHM03_00042150 [Ensete ventricosum]|nr:hypothetical protein BHM03_00042150 [Ensete ventricosum]